MSMLLIKIVLINTNKTIDILPITKNKLRVKRHNEFAIGTRMQTEVAQKISVKSTKKAKMRL